jgi:hypothetical protein
MRLLALLLLASSLAAQTPRLPAHLPSGYKPPPKAEWRDGRWVCPEGWRVPPGGPPVDIAGTKVEAPTCLPPPQHPPQPKFNDSEPHGIWSAPQSHVEWAYMEVTGHLIWKHYKVSYAPLTGRLIRVCEIKNMTYWLPYRFDHDPKNLVLTRTSFEFDAVAGDDISWRVCSL